MRDYLDWHTAYDRPDSGLSWRLRTVQAWIADALDERAGRMRVLSACSGDGRDLLDVLAVRVPDRARVSATLLEIHPELARRARARAAGLGIEDFEVLEVDAGLTDHYRARAPADLVLLVGILGNISHDDVRATVDATAWLCAPGGTLIWSRGRDTDDLNDEIRARLAGSGVVETGYAQRDDGSRPPQGRARVEGPARPVPSGDRLFTFLR